MPLIGRYPSLWAMLALAQAAFAGMTVLPGADPEPQIQELAEQGKFEEAIQLSRRHLEELGKDTAKNRIAIAQSENNLALVLMNIGKFGEAEPLLDHVFAVFKTRPKEFAREIGILINNRCIIYDAKAEYRQGLERVQEAMRVMESAGPLEPVYGMLLLHRAGFQRDLGQRDSAVASYRRCLAFLEPRFGADHINIAAVKNNFGELQFDAGRYAEALALYEESQKIFEKHWKAGDPNFSGCYNNRGKAEMKLGHLEQAEKLLLQSVALKGSLPAGDPGLEENYGWLAELYAAMGKKKEAGRYAGLRDKSRKNKKTAGKQATIINRKDEN